MPHLKPSDRPRGVVTARAIDFCVALLASVLLSPLIAIRTLAGRLESGRWIEMTPALGVGCRMITLLDFAGRLPGRRLARVLNLLRGDLALAGPAPARIGERGHWLRTAPERFALRPGLVRTNAARDLMGIESTSEPETDREFVASHHALSPATL